MWDLQEVPVVQGGCDPLGDVGGEVVFVEGLASQNQGLAPPVGGDVIWGDQGYSEKGN